MTFVTQGDRPPLEESVGPRIINALACKCWQSKTDARPTFALVHQRLTLALEQQPHDETPDRLLIYACSPTRAPLGNVHKEANEILDDYLSHSNAVISSGTAGRLRRRLLDLLPLRFLFAGHADDRLGGERTLAFTDDEDNLSKVRPDALARMFHSVRRDRRNVLELVFLNGCNSEGLGRAVQEEAGGRLDSPRPRLNAP